MSKYLSPAMIIGLLLAIIFIAIALYLLIFPGSVPTTSKEDIRLYALLTGAYGIWRAIRVWLAWKEAQENV
jgi:TctA family transporter